MDKGDCWRMAKPMYRLCYTLEESSCTKCIGGGCLALGNLVRDKTFYFRPL